MNARREVPFFNYQALFKLRETEYSELIRDVLGRGAYILQRDLEEFEENLAAFLKVKYAFGVADGTNALMLALRAAGIGLGDEVILPSHTYVATAAAVHYVGAIPVLVECGEDHLIDPDSARSAVTRQTKAIVPVQLNGRTANMNDIQMIADEHGLVVIEDAAQGLGSRFQGKYAGTFGLAGTFSFYPAKLLGAFGDGGGVVTNDDEVGEKLGLLRDHGRNREGIVVAWGTNCRLDNLQAAILDLKLRTYDADIRRRREIAVRYQDSLEDLPQVTLPPPPSEDGDHYDVYQNYEIEAVQRDELQSYLKDQGVGTVVQFGGKAVHQYPLGFHGVNLPKTEQLYRRALLLPMHTALGDDDVDYTVELIRYFYESGEVIA